MILCSLPMPTGAEWGVLLASYLVGSIPFGYGMARLKGVNLHATGSGNRANAFYTMQVAPRWVKVLYIYICI